MTFDEFDAVTVGTTDAAIFVRSAGTGPPVVLLHGFPETHLMWRRVAPRLAGTFTVVCLDLRGYGSSSCPPSGDDHASYANRAMARDVIDVMQRLGHRTFVVVGHDRGARVGYRLSLDAPDRVERLVALDVVPTLDAWERADARFAQAFWPWSLLAQPPPLPERMLVSAPDAIVDAALGGWGSDPAVFEPEVRAAYVAALADPEHAHAICEEYRAAATIDVDHDRADRSAGRRLACPVLVAWSARGPLGTWYEEAGGPLGIWRAWADSVVGQAMPGGHFFPEEQPDETAALIARFITEL